MAETRAIPTAEQLAAKFHDTYELLAPRYGYKTRESSAKPWSEVPEPNKSLMIAVAHEVLVWLSLAAADPETQSMKDSSTLPTTPDPNLPGGNDVRG